MTRRTDSIEISAQIVPPLLGAMRFSAEWRDYQKRVLEQMDFHLADGRLHIVAAPGSGKTVLGLEALRRLARPAILLSPTLTIRNQWRERLCPLFLPDLAPWRGHVSSDLSAPSDMTISTYQALHTAWAAGKDEESASTFAALENLGPVTLILDECHHLRREWWNALFDLRAALPDVTIVALTATPPYDASPAEWQRYEDLCGPIDTEIGVPELVRNGDLAPHQDYVFFSEPSQDLVTALRMRREAVFAQMEDLAADQNGLDHLAAHPFLTDPLAHEEAVLERPEAMSSLMVLLHHAGRPLPREAQKFLGIKGVKVPEFSPFWLQHLLQLILFTNIAGWELDEAERKQKIASLSEAGLISNGRVQFTETHELARQLSHSGAKLDSILAILHAERAAMGETLRMAVLTDHVRAAELPREAGARYDPQRLGIVPIFETLRRAGTENHLGVLSGSLVIIPASACVATLLAAQQLHLDLARVTMVPLAHDPSFCRVEIAGGQSNLRVALITLLFAQGHIRVLVGTQALLGEGWDAPSINSLVLASNAGSFMLSNQMRGRAIRTDPAQAEKVSNIWHLATIDRHAIEGEGADMRLIKRRFAMFDGVPEGVPEGGDALIENGLERLNVAFDQPVQERNRLTLLRASDRMETTNHWRRSLGAATHRSQVREVAEMHGSPIDGSFQMHVTLQTLAVSALGGGVMSAGFAMQSSQSLGWLLLATGGLTLLYSLPGLFNSAMLFMRNGTLERRLEQVGMVVMEGLAHAGQLSRPPGDYQIRVVLALNGNHAVTLDGGTRADQHRFVDAMLELLGPVQNPRYLLRRYGKVLGMGQVDYHAVPSAIATHRKHADFFLGRWQLHIGKARMDFTRSAHGRRMLLQARTSSLAAGIRNPLERRSMWL